MTDNWQPDFPPSGKFQSLEDIRRQWLKILSGIFLVALTSLWLGELVMGCLSPMDKLAYPALLSLTSLSLILLQLNPRAYKIAVMVIVGVLTAYQLIFLQAIIWGYLPTTNGYKLATFVQWFPLIYLLTFVFVRRKYALGFSLFVYGWVALSALGCGWLAQVLPVQKQAFPYLLNMVIAHPIYISIFTAVASLQKSFSQFQTDADIDYLTNLSNRRAASRALERALSSHAQASIGVMLIDIDRFKTINDAFGHGIGDQVLVQVGKLFQQGLRKTDIASRWGGEEFLVVLVTTTASELYQTAERLRLRLEAYPHPAVGQVTASFGVAIARPGDRLETLLRRADQALFKAKRAGRNRVVVADPID
ncbi:MAG: GGDEF domain-containing protein [Cyanobacteria bacterium REEB459]|nr:GGDEF domain-containing protein [Cyanobacteria bacterium REEB459]